MKCEGIIKLIHKQEGGKLSPAEERVLDSHLQECSVCREKIIALEKIQITLKTRVAAPPDDFTDNIMAEIAVEDGIFKRLLKPLLLFTRWKAAKVFAAAAVFLALYSVFIEHKKTPSDEISISFTIKAPDAESVSLAGDFNGWDTKNLKLERNNGVWQIILPLPPGRYQYAFVVDGNKWMSDPEAEDYVDNGYGSRNSVLDTMKL